MLSRIPVFLAAIVVLLDTVVATAQDARNPPIESGHSAHQNHGAGAGAKSLAPEDDRQSIRLTPAERDFVLHEMRGFLQSVEGVVAAVANDRISDAETPARKSGMSVMHDVPPTLPQKLPKEFKMMGRATHQGFDALADEAKTMGDKSAVLKQLEQILTTCNTCHASYRLSGG